jgi:methionyl-tRNA formyltransferase
MSDIPSKGTRTLVVTDNPELLQAFQRLATNIPAHHFSYAHSFNNRNPAQLVQLGCASVNVKAEADRIIRDFDLVFSLHCKQIFPARLVNAVRCINLHPGLNPHNRGWFPQVFSIMNGLPAGATLHEMVEEVDRGPVIAQQEVEVHADDTSRTAYDRIQQTEIMLLEQWLPQVLTGDYSTTETASGNYNGIADFQALCPIDREETGTFGEFIDRLRALSHPPYRNAYFVDKDGKRVYLTLQLDREDD